MADTVQQIKDRLSIVDVVSQYVKLDRAGASLRARCPFHAERTPSFHVSPDRGTYHCFGCNVGGDIFSFVEAIEGLDFKGALKVLAEKAGVEIVYERGGKGEKDERERMFELLEVATIKEFRLGLAGDAWSELSDFLKTKKFSDREVLEVGLAKKNERGNLTDKFRNRILFPIADSAGRVIGFSGRIFGENASPEAPKYLNSPETPLFHKSRILYGFDRAKTAIRKHNCAVLVEGQMDLLASHQAGWGNTVAVSGTAFTPEHAQLIRRMTDNLLIALDADAAGIKAAGRPPRAALPAGLHVKVASLPAELDPADLIQKEGADAWKKAIREAKDIITFLLDVLEEHAKSPDNFRRSVESIVLPFLADVQSPIAREQYVREIAGRLHVSESAVASAFAKMPKIAPDAGHTGQVAAVPRDDAAKTALARSDGRAQQAFSILLWQASLPKPEMDITAYRSELAEAIGTEALEALERLPGPAQGSLRFSAERLYGTGEGVARRAKALLDVISQELLANELALKTEALRRAEKEGNEAEKSGLMKAVDMLIKRIAQLKRGV